MKSRVIHILAILLAVLLVSSPAAFAAKGVIIVKCVDASGNPMEKLQVLVQGIKQDKLKKEKTDKTGTARIEKLDDDLYRVWGRENGYTPAFYEFVKLENEGTVDVTLKFEAGNADVSLYFEDQAVLEQSNLAMREGAQALQAGQYDLSIQKLNESLAINPSNPTTLHNLGLAQLSKGEFDQAEETLKEVIALLELFISIDDSQGLKNQASDIQAVLDSMPLRRVAYAADQAMRNRKFDEAVVALKEMVKLQPDNANAWYHMSVALTQGRNFEEAKGTIAKAIEFAPDNSTFKELQGRIDALIEAAEKEKERTQVAAIQKLVDDQKYEEAVAQIPATVEAVSEEYHSSLWTEAARAYLALEKYDEAFDAYAKSQSLSGGSADEGIFKIGQELTKKGKLGDARKAYEFTLKINPNFAEAYYELGMDAFYETNDKVKAKEYLTKYMEIGQDEAKKSNAQNVLIVMGRSK